MTRIARTLALLTVLSTAGPPLHADAQTREADGRAMLDRAVVHFMAGRIGESVAEFDRLVRAAPAQAPYLWQRGIALYYAGRYDDCRAQFEAHRLVNPSDVENAAWHFLCAARAASPERANTLLLPVGPDPRVPMRQIYELFRGALGPDEVLAAAVTGARARFYAHLYIGLHAEAVGDAARALEHLTAAADPQYASAGDYMHGVARVHAAMLQR